MANRREIPQANPPFEAPFLDAANRITPTWARWLSNGFMRQGGTRDDIYLLLFGLLTSATQQGAVSRDFDGLSDALATLQSLVYGRQDSTAKIATLEDEIASLRAEVLARKAYDGQIEELRVSVDTLRLQAADLQQRQQAILKTTDASINNAQTFSIGQAQTAFSQYAQLNASITGVNDTVSSLTTTSVPEGTRLYYTDARARASLAAGGSLNYNSATGVFSIVVGSAAYQNTGTSGTNVPLLDGANTWSGNQTFGNGSSAALANINGAAATTRDLNFQTNGSLRWLLRCGSGAESGSNAGSDFVMFAYDDSGVLIGSVYTINRNQRNWTFTVRPAAPGYLVGVNQVVGARIAGWTAATGTATRTTFATSTVTLPVLAEHVKALIDDLITHGLIGT